MNVDDLESGLVRRARDGDEEAFAGLVERHWARLVPLARSVVGEAEAEDVVQEGLILAWRKLGSLRDIDAFPAWLTRVVLRVCLRTARAARSWVSLDGLSDPPQLDGKVEFMLDVERIIGALAPQQRAVMHFTVVEGMSDSEIGIALGLRPSSVRSHRRRAREALSRRLERKGQDDG